jgi:hypothetical protein
VTAFKYPPPSQGTLDGNSFYRVNALAVGGKNSDVSIGDLIPIDVGFNAIVVGPDSDYEKYELYYPDPLAEGTLQQVAFSADSPFIGAVFPNGVAEYPGTNGQKALAFVRPVESPLAFPFLGIDSNPETDLILYTGTPPIQLPRGRVVKNRRGFVPVGAPGPGLIRANHSMPGFGRGYFGAHVKNRTLAQSIDVIVQGITSYYPASTAGTANSIIDTTLVASVAVAAGGELRYQHDSRVDGFFDYFVVNITTGGADILPSDSATQQSIFLSMEVRD